MSGISCRRDFCHGTSAIRTEFRIVGQFRTAIPAKHVSQYLEKWEFPVVIHVFLGESFVRGHKHQDALDEGHH